jgi:Family of unknown function (DUF6600)
MKRFLYLTVFLLVVAAAGAMELRAADNGPTARSGPASPPQAFGATLDIGYCYDYLAPFGTWLQLDPWGYVWCPRHMGYRWRPYADGDWIWTDWGWTWMSDFEWGWMPFHYGRWGWDNDCGWFWVPGTVWGPAWVSWRWSDLYFGWAPIPPGFEFRPGIDFDVVAAGIPFNFWVFVSGRHFLDRDLNRYVLPYERNNTIVGLTRIRNNFEFRGSRLVNNGIDPETIRRITRQSFMRYSLTDADRPGATRILGGEARLYRPSFREDASAKPREFMPREQARRDLGQAKIYEPRPQAPAANPESAIQKRQAQERKLLGQSQAEERKAMQRQAQAEAGRAMGQADKAQRQQEQQARMAEQRKQHQDEQQRMTERHRQDTEQVRRSSGGSERSTPPPRPKKK